MKRSSILTRMRGNLDSGVMGTVALARSRDWAWSLVRTVLIVGIGFIIVFPVLTKISSSLMVEDDLYDKTVKWIPRNFTLDNYRLVWEQMRYGEAFLRSLGLTVLVSTLQLASCTLIGYGLARFRFPGHRLLSAVVIFMLLVPPEVIMIPLYLNFRYFDPLGLIPGEGVSLLNSVWPFVLTSLTGTGMRNGLFIYIMRQYFAGMPSELEEAAYVDGAEDFKIFTTIMLPGAGPVLVIVFLFSFVWQWNDDYMVSIFMSNHTLLANMLSNLVANVTEGEFSYTIQYMSLLNNTGSLLFIAPLLILYAFMQRYFIESVERTGLVG